MTTTDDTDLHAAVTEMVAEAKALRGEVSVVAKAGQANRRMIRLTATSVALDVLLSVGLGWTIHRTNTTADKAKAVASTISQVCAAANGVTQKQLDLWHKLLGFSPPPNETAAQKTAREVTTAEFRIYLDQAYVIRDCKK